MNEKTTKGAPLVMRQIVRIEDMLSDVQAAPEHMSTSERLSYLAGRLSARRWFLSVCRPVSGPAGMGGR